MRAGWPVRVALLALVVAPAYLVADTVTNGALSRQEKVEEDYGAGKISDAEYTGRTLLNAASGTAAIVTNVVAPGSLGPGLTKVIAGVQKLEAAVAKFDNVVEGLQTAADLGGMIKDAVMGEQGGEGGVEGGEQGGGEEEELDLEGMSDEDLQALLDEMCGGGDDGGQSANCLLPATRVLTRSGARRIDSQPASRCSVRPPGVRSGVAGRTVNPRVTPTPSRSIGS